MLNQPVIDFLLWLTKYTKNLGLSIIVFTVILRLLLVPITQKSVESAQKMKELTPELKELQKKFAKNPKALQAAQLELYKKHQINPIAGCLPQLIQVGLLIILYQALIHFFAQIGNGESGHNLNFLWMNISHPDKTFVLPVLAALPQLALSWLMAWQNEPSTTKKKPVKKSSKQTDKQLENQLDMSESMAQMQKQMLYVMPIMTGVIAVSLPSGLVLYWFFSSLFSLFQQAYVMRSKIKARFKI